jgi:hypothetical protein
MDVMDRWLAVNKAVVDQNATPSQRAMPFEPRPDDVIAAGMMKSGSTWMQQILHQIRTKGDEDFKEIYEVVPYLPDYNQRTNFDANADQKAEPRLFKSHAIFETTPNLEGKTRFVVTLRDPHDTELSLMKFMWRYFGHDKDMNSDDYKKFTSQIPTPDFASFTASWWRQRHNPQVLLMPYDDLKKDLAGCVQKMSKFLNGKPLSEDELAKVLHLCSFEYMSNNQDKFTGDNISQFLSKETNIEHLKPVGGMVRLDGGQVGQGKMLLNADVRQYVDDRWKEIMEKEHGIKSYQELYQLLKSNKF